MIEKLYELILKEGLMRYKYKNSKCEKILDIEKVKGSIFIYRTKKDMTSSKGIVLTSIEALFENKHLISHWTPNIYRYGTYLDEKRKITTGHYEENLRQINTFFLDIDQDNISTGDILSVSYELGFLPTCVIKTAKGYQVYYVLESPVYITKHSDYKAIEIAKKVSNNLRRYFIKEKIQVDTLCNHFGIARVPTEENIEYIDLNNIYTFADWLDWSIKEDDRVEESINKRKNFYILSNTSGQKQINEKWFTLLLNTRKVKGSKDLLGRNNIIFTLALACYSSGLSEEECYDKIQIFNNNLEERLKDKEYKKIISSAYSSKYTGASSEYVITLCKKWVDEKITTKDLFNYQKWVKFKKERKYRTRIHFDEWEKDILTYIDKKESIYLELTKKAMIDDLKIPKRSLDVALNNLKEKGVIIYKATSGRGGGIRVALLKKVYLNAIKLVNTAKEKYLKELSAFFYEPIDYIKEAINKYQDNSYIVKQTLFEEDVGKILII